MVPPMVPISNSRDASASKKVEENKAALEVFTLKYKWAGDNSDTEYLSEPYCPSNDNDNNNNSDNNNNNNYNYNCN